MAEPITLTVKVSSIFKSLPTERIAEYITILTNTKEIKAHGTVAAVLNEAARRLREQDETIVKLRSY